MPWVFCRLLMSCMSGGLPVWSWLHHLHGDSGPYVHPATASWILSSGPYPPSIPVPSAGIPRHDVRAWDANYQLAHYGPVDNSFGCRQTAHPYPQPPWEPIINCRIMRQLIFPTTGAHDTTNINLHIMFHLIILARPDHMHGPRTMKASTAPCLRHPHAPPHATGIIPAPMQGEDP